MVCPHALETVLGDTTNLLATARMDGCAILEELDYLCTLIWVQVPPHVLVAPHATSVTSILAEHLRRIRQEG